MSDSEKKIKLIDLRVLELRNELEKRSLDVSGVKVVLLERLTQALKDDGEDPEEYLFEADKKTVKKQAIRGSIRSSGQKEDNSEPNTSVDMVSEEFEDVDQVGEIEKDEDTVEVVKASDLEPTTVPLTKEIPAVALLVLNVQRQMENDNEDSLNLTIGEEDEQLLRDETENDSKDNNDIVSNQSKTVTSEEYETGKDDKNERSGDEKDCSKKQTDGENVSKTNGNSKNTGKDEKESSSKTTSSSVRTKITAPASTNTACAPISRNLWVSGLSSLTRATDLKQIFSKYGKVIGAKVVTNTRSPGTRCYGYVTMATPKDATECIDNLHHTELHGRMISVERAKSDLKSDLGTGPPAIPASSTVLKPALPLIEKKVTPTDAKPSRKEEHNKKTLITAPDNTDSKKSADDKSSKIKESSTTTTAKKKRDEAAKKTTTTKDSSRKSRERASIRVERKGSAPGTITATTSRKRSEERKREILSFNKIREQRDRQRLREKERELREEERRRREIRRRQREEEQRLTREREKLALERAKIEKEKAELLKLEKEKLEYERIELTRIKRKIEEAKRSMKRPISTDRHYADRKRPATESSRRFEAPPPPRFDPPITSRNSSQYDRVTPSDSKKRVDDYPQPPVKREDFTSKRDDYKSTYKRGDDYNKRDAEMSRHSNSSYERSSGPSIVTSKESRYSDRSAAIEFRSARNVESERDRNGGSNKPRYLDPPADNRYNDRSSGVSTNSSAWHNPTLPQIKPFGNIPNNNVNEMWNTKVDNGWRSSMDNNQDRYDRTYNERKTTNSQPSPFMIDTVRPNQFIGSGLGNVIQPRYGAVPSRYENGRF